MIYSHDGFEIRMTGDAKFYTTIDGKRVTKPSLDALKKHIDKRKASLFEPFDAIIRYGRGLHDVKVVGLSSERMGRYRKARFRIEGGPRGYVSTDSVYPTSERGKLENLLAFDEETDRIRDERLKQYGQLEDAIEERKAEDE